ncbi:MAG: hypothetical protein J6K97_03830 [Clostridia bacterium]|nr:hypothetical protein [Clostridia bacterium]
MIINTHYRCGCAIDLCPCSCLRPLDCLCGNSCFQNCCGFQDCGCGHWQTSCDYTPCQTPFQQHGHCPSLCQFSPCLETLLFLLCQLSNRR